MWVIAARPSVGWPDAINRQWALRGGGHAAIPRHAGVEFFLVTNSNLNWTRALERLLLHCRQHKVIYLQISSYSLTFCILYQTQVLRFDLHIVGIVLEGFLGCTMSLFFFFNFDGWLWPFFAFKHSFSIGCPGESCLRDSEKSKFLTRNLMLSSAI